MLIIVIQHFWKHLYTLCRSWLVNFVGFVASFMYLDLSFCLTVLVTVDFESHYIHTDGLYSFIHKGTLIFLQWSHMLRIWGVTRCQNRRITLFCLIWSSKGALWTNICVVANVFHYWGRFKYKDLLCFYLVSFSIVFTFLFISGFDLITTVICFTTY